MPENGFGFRSWTEWFYNRVRKGAVKEEIFILQSCNLGQDVV